MGYKDLKFKQDTLFLVTGGAGFIGSNLCEAIINLGYRVRCLDNLSTGKYCNIEELVENNRFEFVHGDIKNFEVCKSVCNGVDYVLHHAASASVPESIEKPLLYSENNIQGFLHILEASRQNSVKRVVYATSSAVYGDDEVQPKIEEMVGKMLSPYALTKKCNEEWAKQYTMHYGLSTCGLRYFNVFGKRQDPNGAYAAVIPKFIHALMKSEQPVIYGDGRQSRDFTYIENVIEANLKGCLADSRASGEVFNIAFGESVDLLTVYQLIAGLLGINIMPRFEKKRKGDIVYSSANLEKAKKILRYEPQYNFYDGIKEVINWYKLNTKDYVTPNG